MGKVMEEFVLNSIWRSQVSLNKEPHPCQLLTWRKWKQSPPTGINKILQWAVTYIDSIVFFHCKNTHTCRVMLAPR